MANANYPAGFEPVRKSDGTSMTLKYGDVSSSNAEIGLYDPVERRADGYVHRAQAGTVSIVGVAAEHKAANAGGTIAFYPVENTVFVAQVDDTVDAQTDIGLNYDIVLGSITSNGRSGAQIDGSTQAATATLPVKIEKVYPYTDSNGTNAIGSLVKVECIFNQSESKGAGVAGI